MENSGIWDSTEKWRGIQDLTVPGKWDSPKLGMGCRISI